MYSREGMDGSAVWKSAQSSSRSSADKAAAPGVSAGGGELCRLRLLPRLADGPGCFAASRSGSSLSTEVSEMTDCEVAGINSS